MQSLKIWTEACWDGYKQIGMKKKGKRKVPNCVPEEEELEGTQKKRQARPTHAKVLEDDKDDKVPPGYHRMPDGSIMKDSDMEENAAKRRAKKAAYAKKTMKKYGDAAKMGMNPADVNQRRNKPTLKKR
jgi:hypothetical protein